MGLRVTFGLVQLYDGGTNGDDVAGDGIFSRSCVHYCNSKVNYNDIYGFAYGVNVYGQELVALDPSKKGTIPFKEIDTPLTPALLQIFGDVFDIVTVSPLDGKVGAGIYKWQNWDRRGGPRPEEEIGNIETCAVALTGFPTYRMVSVITSPNPANSGEFQDWIHEVIHSVGGFEFHNIYGGARPVWDWVNGYSHEIPRLGGLGGLRLEADANCNSCKQNELAQCCSFRYENRPITEQEMVEHPELCTITMSTIMQYISVFIDFKDVPWNKRTYYCMGSDTDGGCGSEGHHEKSCIIPVNDDDSNAVTSTFVQRFTLNQWVKANRGKRFPTKKFDVIRHAPALVSDVEMVFYTLFWRQQEIVPSLGKEGLTIIMKKIIPMMHGISIVAFTP